MAANPTSTATRSYGLGPKRKWVMYGAIIGLLAALALIAVADPKGGIAAALVLLVAIAPTIAILGFFARYPRLTVTAEGLRLRGAMGFSTIFVPWSNLEQLRLKGAAGRADHPRAAHRPRCRQIQELGRDELLGRSFLRRRATALHPAAALRPGPVVRPLVWARRLARADSATCPVAHRRTAKPREIV